ncbi:hypothetical protein LCGC14_1433060, partial [marine sediment metagenome]
MASTALGKYWEWKHFSESELWMEMVDKLYDTIKHLTIVTENPESTVDQLRVAQGEIRMARQVIGGPGDKMNSMKADMSDEELRNLNDEEQDDA